MTSRVELASTLAIPLPSKAVIKVLDIRDVDRKEPFEAAECGDSAMDDIIERAELTADTTAQFSIASAGSMSSARFKTIHSC